MGASEVDADDAFVLVMAVVVLEIVVEEDINLTAEVVLKVNADIMLKMLIEVVMVFGVVVERLQLLETEAKH